MLAAFEVVQLVGSLLPVNPVKLSVNVKVPSVSSAISTAEDDCGKLVTIRMGMITRSESCANDVMAVFMAFLRVGSWQSSDFGDQRSEWKLAVVSHQLAEVGMEVGKAEVIGRSAEVRKFSVGKRRAGCTRGGSAMDGRKRAGSTALGRAASKASKRGFANRRTSFMVMTFMAG